jgi:predicted DNA-binding protein (UPF0251 family)
MDAMRSWLASGNHIFGVDPRRRLGHHGHARQLHAEDLREGHASAGEWQALASALDRHTIRGGMAELSAEERRVITLAYLEGRTNREIADMLGVSVSTVRRRLLVGLKRLDAYVSRTRSWLTAVLLLGAAYAIERTVKLERWANADWTHKLASTVAVGAVAVAAIGLTAISPDSVRPETSTHATAPGLATRPTADETAPSAEVSDVGPVQSVRILNADGSHHVSPIVRVITPVDSPSGDGPSQGCQSNPTSAAPPVPVGSPSGHPAGAPVSHPTAGGCRT